MRTRILSFRRAFAAIQYTPVRRFRGEDRCDAHMNELPVPCGPWAPFYKDKQKTYNRVLFAGVVWWIFSLVLMLWTESFQPFWSPPCQPGPPSDMVEECEDEDS